MLLLIVLLVFGLGVAYFAMQNTTVVMLNLFGNIIPGVPLFFVVIGSMLVGFVVAYVIYVAHSVTSGVKMWGKEMKIKEVEGRASTMEERIRELEAENQLLRAKKRSSRK